MELKDLFCKYKKQHTKDKKFVPNLRCLDEIEDQDFLVDFLMLLKPDFDFFFRFQF